MIPFVSNNKVLPLEGTEHLIKSIYTIDETGLSISLSLSLNMCLYVNRSEKYDDHYGEIWGHIFSHGTQKIIIWEDVSLIYVDSN